MGNPTSAKSSPALFIQSNLIRIYAKVLAEYFWTIRIWEECNSKGCHCVNAVRGVVFVAVLFRPGSAQASLRKMPCFM